MAADDFRYRFPTQSFRYTFFFFFFFINIRKTIRYDESINRIDNLFCLDLI